MRTDEKVHSSSCGVSNTYTFRSLNLLKAFDRPTTEYKYLVKTLDVKVLLQLQKLLPLLLLALTKKKRMPLTFFFYFVILALPCSFLYTLLTFFLVFSPMAAPVCTPKMF